jgi:NADPH-dependent 2,4-dienoyl-CoA reductase/sulfur reductase-like enzyme
MQTVAIVGASLAGLRAAETLRSNGFNDHIMLIGNEASLPYNRPPLSKQFLTGDWEADRLPFLKSDQFEGLNIIFRSSTDAVAIDIDLQTIALSDNSRVEFDGLVIATGARATQLTNLTGRPNVFTLRSLEDSQRLGQALTTAKSLVVIGGGFIGSEVAASAHGMGIETTIIESQDALMLRGLGSLIGNALTNFHRAHGVDVRCNSRVTRVVDDGIHTSIELTDGTSLSPDVIVVGVGASPATDWLEDSSIALDDGVITDSFCRVQSKRGDPLPKIVAAGDVARWYSTRHGRHVRSEHWTNAQEQGAAAAQTLLADLGINDAIAPTYDPVPYMWSDQFGKKIQVVGFPEINDTTHIVQGALEEAKFLALVERDGQLVGSIGMAMVPALVKARSLLNENASFAQESEAFSVQAL